MAACPLQVALTIYKPGVIVVMFKDSVWLLSETWFCRALVPLAVKISYTTG